MKLNVHVPLHTCQHHSTSPCSLISFCYWSCLSLYLLIKIVILSIISTKIKFEFCRHLIANRINYDKNENQDLQVVYIVLLLVFAYWNFSFSIPSAFEAFLLSVLHCCLMDDDLEFCLVMEIIMLVAVRKNGFSEI